LATKLAEFNPRIALLQGNNMKLKIKTICAATLLVCGASAAQADIVLCGTLPNPNSPGSITLGCGNSGVIVSGTNTINYGHSITNNGTNVIQLGGSSTVGASAANSTVIGEQTTVFGSNVNLAGHFSQVAPSGNGATALGNYSNTTGANAISLGNGTANSGTNSVAVGNAISNLTGSNSVSTGTGSSVTANGGGAIGSGSSSSATNAYAIGNGASATQAGAVALGSGSTTDAAIATTGVTLLGQGYTFAGTAPTSTVSVGTVGGERTVTNVAAGQLNASSTDLVNGSQLAATNAALANLSDRSVLYDLNADGSVNRANVSMAGPTSTDGGITGGTTYTNVHQGAVNATSTDAVNGAQIYNIAGDTSNTYITQNGRGVRYVRTNDTGLPLADALAQGQGSSALGYNAAATGQAALATGNNATASGQDAIASGTGSAASGTGSIAVGAGATAAQDGAIALGAGSTTSIGVDVGGTTIAGSAYTFAGANGSTQGTVSVGAVGAERQVQNVAAGQLSATSTDLVNGSQLAATNTALGKLNDRSVQYDLNPDGSVNYANVTMRAPDGTTYTNVHQGAVNANSTDAVNGAQIYNIAGDTSNTYVTQNGRGVRYVRTNDAGLPLADALAQGKGASAMGYNAVATGQAALATGNNATASGQDAIASGTGSVATGIGSIALGAGASASQSGSVALGAGSSTSLGVDVAGTSIAGNTYAFAGANGAGQGTVSVGVVGSERQIQNVASGQLNAGSTDLVNGSQLFATNSALNRVDAHVNVIDGRVTVIEGQVNDLYQQTGDLDKRTTTLENTAVRYDVRSDGITDFNNITLGESQGSSPTRISNVADGLASSDMVNIGQLSGMKRAVYAGIASSLASGIVPTSLEANKSVFGVGVGSYGGESAIAVGASRVSDNGRTTVKGTIAASTDGKLGLTINAGILF
jgi:autotransporter adhesin